MGLLVRARREHRHVAADLGARKLHGHAAHRRRRAADSPSACPRRSCPGKKLPTQTCWRRFQTTSSALVVLSAGSAYSASRSTVRTGSPASPSIGRDERLRHPGWPTAAAGNSCSAAAARGVSQRIAELVEVVARQQEHAVFAPLEALARAARSSRCVVAPRPWTTYTTSSKASRTGRQHAARRHFADARLGDALLAFELDERRVAAALRPAAERERAQVLDVVAAVDRQAERVHPAVVGELEHGRRSYLRFRVRSG